MNDMEATLNKETIERIEALKKIIEKKGVVKDEVVKHLSELRPHLIEQNEPLLTRVARLTAEYVGEHGYFDLNLLADEEEDEEGNIGTLEEEIDMEGEDSFNESKENFLYLLDLIAHPDNSLNREELTRVKHLYLDRDLF
ncbi:MAG: hypothetical protein ABR572_04120 [Cryomorphaceae bacterium]|nr:hypothetical protein [Flavobacteriales bacterium]